jgi:hypothetical protein
LVASTAFSCKKWKLIYNIGTYLMRTSALLLCLARLQFSRSMIIILSLWRMGAGWRLWWLSWLIAWLCRWQFVASLAWVMLTLVLCAMVVMSVCNISFVELLPFLFGVFWRMCGESSCNVFLLLFMVLWVPISAMPCKRAVFMLWHALVFLGLRFFPLFFFLLGGLC